MQKMITMVTTIILIMCFTIYGAFAQSSPQIQNHNGQNALAGINVAQLIKVTSATGLKPVVLKAALNAYAWARDNNKLGSNKDTLTIVDFTLPSNKKRMWILNLKNTTILMQVYTTQGKHSGLIMATHFSNRRNSLESSLGLYITSNEYHGEHGLSMRLNGVEKGINTNARKRSVVIHSAFYATPKFVKKHGRAGRSWGCFALNPKIKDQVLNYVKGGSALFAYATTEKDDPIVANGPLSLT